MSEVKPFDRELWRDFDWEGFIAGGLLLRQTDGEKEDFKQAIQIARNLARLFEKGADLANMKELVEYEKTIPQHLLLEVAATLAMIGNVMYKKKHEEGAKLTFAIGTIAQLAKMCRAHRLKGVEPVLKQFVLEVGEDILPPK